MVPWNPARQAVAKGAICVEKHTHQEIQWKKKKKKKEQLAPSVTPQDISTHHVLMDNQKVSSNHNNAELH